MSTSTATRPTRSTPRPARIPTQRPAPEPVTMPVTMPAQRAPRPAARPSGQGSVRLTRRGRIVLTLLLLGLVFAAFVVFSGQSVATGEAGTPVPTRTVVVGEGDTLWDIASEVSPGGDIREVVHEIERLNSLPGPELTVGQEIAVPVG